MTLKLSKNIELTDLVSEDLSSPFTTTHAAAGSSVESKLYLFNDDPLRTYTNVTVAPLVTGVVQVAPDVSGAPGAYVDSLSMTVGAPNTAAPLWVKVTTPAITESQTDQRLVTSGDWTSI